MSNETSWDEAAHIFYKKVMTVRWDSLGGGVYYAFAGDGLYVVKEIGTQAPWQSQTFSFYKARSIDELKRLYYGGAPDAY